MNYVEFLHVARTLRNLAIILGLIILLALIGRPFSHGNDESYAIPKDVPVQTEHRADGTTVQRFTSDRGNHVTVQTDSQGTQKITVVSPARAAHKTTSFKFGPVSVRTNKSGKTNITVITHDPHFSAGTLFLIASFVGAIVAAIFGLALSRENDGHLELAWTKPASRLRYAAGAILTDLAGVLGSLVLAFFTLVAVLAIYGEAGHMQFYTDSWIDAVFAVAFAVSFYGIIIGVTASLRRGTATGAFAVIFPVIFLLPIFRAIHGTSGTVGRAIDTVIPNAAV
ncbi:MAG: hypothetical protein NVSMB31_19280 [Vulcanimicrobiaceae bacterium]